MNGKNMFSVIAIKKEKYDYDVYGLWGAIGVMVFHSSSWRSSKNDVLYPILGAYYRMKKGVI